MSFDIFEISSRVAQKADKVLVQVGAVIILGTTAKARDTVPRRIPRRIDMKNRTVHRAARWPSLLRLPCIFLATTIAIGGASAGEVPPTAAERSVNVPDVALRRVLEEALGKGSGDPITRGEMAGLRELAADGVKQLAGIEYAVNLVGLEAKRGGISNLAPLANLTSLTFLELRENAIADLALAGLSSLTYLNLHGNAIADLAPLAHLSPR